jgi:hypothetical protein
MHEIGIWADANNANEELKDITVSRQKIKSGDSLKIRLANNGGWVAHIKD